MPEQEKTKLYLVSSLLIDIASKVLSKTLNGVCSRLNNAFEPLLNLNLHNFFHLWKSQPCCQCDGIPVENRLVSLRDADWVRLYQQVKSPCSHKNECSCCYRAYCGIQPSSIDYALATKVLIGLKALSEREFLIVRKLRNFESELKDIQEQRIEQSTRVMVPIHERSRWSEILSTLEQLARELGNGYWENLKEAKELSRLLSEMDNNKDDPFKNLQNDKDFRDDKEDPTEDREERQTIITEEHTPKIDQYSCMIDYEYLQFSDKGDKLSDEKAEDDKTDADSGYPDNMSFRSPRDFHEDEEYEKTRYCEGTLHPVYEEYTEKNTLKDDPLILENRHGLVIQQMKAQSQALARRCYNLSKDTNELLRSKGLPTREFKMPEYSSMNDYTSTRTSSWVSDARKTHEELQLGMSSGSTRKTYTRASSSKDYVGSSLESRDTPPIPVRQDTGGYEHKLVDFQEDATNDRKYNLKADETSCSQQYYKKKMPLTHHVHFNFDTESTQSLGDQSDNVDSSYPGHQKVPLSNEEFKKMIDESYKCLVRSRAILRSTSPLDAGNDFIYSSSAREFTRWFDARNSEEPTYDNVFEWENTRGGVSNVPYPSCENPQESKVDLTPLTMHKILPCSKRTDSDPAQDSSLRGVPDYPRLHENGQHAYKGSEFYMRSVERCEQIRRRSSSIKHELERGRVKLKAINRRAEAFMQSSDSLASIDDTDYMVNESYAASQTCSRGIQNYPSEESYARNIRPLHSLYGRNETPMSKRRSGSYTDKYEKWLKESVQRVRKERKYNGQAATINCSHSLESLFDDDLHNVPDYRDRYSSTPTLSTRFSGEYQKPEAVYDDDDEFLLLQGQTPVISSLRIIQQFSPITALSGNEEMTKQSSDDIIGKELEELKEEKSFGSFLSKSKVSLVAMMERNQRTRKEIERVRFQLHSSGM